MKYKITTILLSLVFTTSSAATAPMPPEKCPSIAAIKKVGVNSARYDDLSGWSVYSEANRFDTNEEWVFRMSISKTKATSEKEALEIANATLSSLILMEGPMIMSDENEYICVYENEDLRVRAATTTPSH